jgi:biofilm PGA synthesis N-glycosyltransferase PgaC
MSDARLLVVSPVFNEARHLDDTARSVAAQTRRPDRWIIVDDGSTDDTLAIARRWERELPFVTVMEVDQGAEGPDRLALAREARAFNLALDAAGWRDFTHVGKLDGDVELPPEWFGTLLQRFADDERLGLAGGRLVEPTPRGWNRIPIPVTHVHGAVKLFDRDCLEAIGGIPERLGWDTIDETYARMRGYGVLSFDDLEARHHRPYGSADGRLRGKARHGECAWILHYSVPWVAARSLKLMRVAPYGVSGLAFLYGYGRAALTGIAQVEDVEFRRFVRRELRARMRRPVRITAGARTPA